jgi:hypothetical protein
MICETIRHGGSHYKILEKLGEARLYRLLKKIISDVYKYQIIFYKKHFVTPGQDGPVRRSLITLIEVK